MGYHLLHDRDHNISAVYDATTGRVLGHEVFEGIDCLETGEAFLGWLLARRYTNITANDLGKPCSERLPDLTDPRVYTPVGLEKVVAQFRADCWDKTEGVLNVFGWRLSAWFNGDRSDDAPVPEPHLKVV